MLSAGFCHVRAVIHNKHCFMRFRKNLHFVLIFVPGPAANERRPREKAEEGGCGVGAQPWSRVPPAEDCPTHLPTHRLPKSRSARLRARARQDTRSRACPRRPRTAPPSSLPPSEQSSEPEEGGASENNGEGEKNALNDCPQSTVGKNGQDDLRESPKVSTGRRGPA